MNITLVRNLPSGYEVRHLDLDDNDTVVEFTVDELRGSPGTYRGHLEASTEKRDGMRVDVLDVRDADTYGQSTVTC